MSDSPLVSEISVRDDIRMLYPNLEVDDPDRFSDLWMEAMQAAKDPSFSTGAARLAHVDPMLSVWLQWKRRWRATPDEGLVMAAFLPWMIETISTEADLTDPEIRKKLQKAAMNVVVSLCSQLKATREQKADTA